MPKGYEVQRLDLKSEDRAVAAVPKGSRFIALDERGREYTTESFARLLQQQMTLLEGLGPG